MPEAVHSQSHDSPPSSPSDAANRSAETAFLQDFMTPFASDEMSPIPKWFRDWCSQSPLPETYPADVIEYYWRYGERLPFPDCWKEPEDRMDQSNHSLVLLEDDLFHLHDHGRLPPDSSRLVDLVGTRIPEKYLSVSF